MIDWNRDGKIDYKDYAFYNNAVEPSMKSNEKNSSNSGGKKNVSTPSHAEEGGKGVTIIIGICILYLIIKLIGG